MLRSFLRPVMAKSTTGNNGRCLIQQHQLPQRCHRRNFASSSSPPATNNGTTSSILESDTGALGTKVHHLMNTSLALLAPVYFLTPDSMTDGTISRGFGLLFAISASIHSWIGLNYVARDYVPKISHALLPPARIAILGLSAITLVGMSKIAVASPGGLKAVVKGVWNPPVQKTEK